MTNRTIPYTSDDLRAIADKLDEIITAIGDRDILTDGDWRWGLSVEVFDADLAQTAGHIKPHPDGWLGFYPTEVSE